MVKYSKTLQDDSKSAKARGDHLRVHFKNAVEVANAVNGKTLARAESYLNNVLLKKEAIPFNTFKGGRGRHAQAKNVSAPGSLCGWPKNAVKFILNLIANAKANAVTKGLDVEKLYISHVACNMAPKGRRRTFRAHGRIGPYMSLPAHIEVILSEQSEPVEKAPETSKITLFRRKNAAKARVVPVGGGL